MTDITTAPKRFLLIRTDRIGDTVLTLPGVTTLRKAFPDAFICFIGQPYTAPLIEQYEGIDLVMSYEAQGKHKGFKGHLQLAEELKSLNFDVAFLFYPRPELAYLLKKTNIPVRIGTGFRWYSFLFSNKIYEHRKACIKHEAEYNHSLVTNWLKSEPEKLEFNFKSWQPETWWKSLLEEIGRKEYIIIHPGSGASAPNLDIRQYRLLVEIILRETENQVVLTGSPTEQKLVDQISLDFPEKRIQKMPGRFALDEFLTLIRNAKMLITSSTGPLHLANAMKTPLLGFFCPAKPHTPARWGPYNQQQWVVTPNLKNASTGSQPDKCKLKECQFSNGEFGKGCLQKLEDQELETALLNRFQAI